MKRNTILIFLVTLTAAACLSACKPPKTPELTVTAVDSAGTKLAGVTVNISTSGTKNGVTAAGNVTDSGVTGSDGTVNFEFNLDVLVRIDAYLAVANGDTLKGTTAAKAVVDEKNNNKNEATVTLK